MTRSISTPLLDGMLVHHRVTPNIEVTGTYLYTWVERDTLRVKWLAQEHNAMTPAWAWPQTAQLELNALSMMPPCSHPVVIYLVVSTGFSLGLFFLFFLFLCKSAISSLSSIDGYRLWILCLSSCLLLRWCDKWNNIGCGWLVDSGVVASTLIAGVGGHGLLKNFVITLPPSHF